MSAQKFVVRNQSLKKWLGDEPRVGDVEIQIDWGKFAKHFGAKAAFNKTGRSRVAGAGIFVRFIPKEKS